ncbi:MAG: hypothetical protein QGD90_09030 [Candidatus Hydrogenedentes bacterium]|nr:hypothetical protein [Candidatus Hydrogenedentota bacterium]
MPAQARFIREFVDPVELREMEITWARGEKGSNPGTWFTNQTGHMVYVFWY